MSLQILINAPFQQGQRKSGVEKGCEALQKLITDNIGINLVEHVEPTILSTENNDRWKQDYFKLYQRLSIITQPYILVGGDHSIGMSSVASSIHKVDNVDNLYVIWIDAHADTNTMEASITKNIHGQPLAGIMGYEDPWFEIRENLPFANLLYFGIRDLDDFEQQKITEHNIFNTRVLSDMVKKIELILNNNPNAVFHVSFDVDALDSSIMKATGCVVDSGLFPNDVITVINMVKHKLIAFDLVEFNPDIGDNVDVFTSYTSIEQIIMGISK